MSIWKELRCDRNTSSDCADNWQVGPMGFDAAAYIRKQARKDGWLRIDGFDVCPFCKSDDAP